MEHTWKIKKMYKLLSATEIKTICKNRKLPVNQHITEDTFKNFFSSSVGVDYAISQLSPEEVAALLLIKADEGVDASNYAMLYPSQTYGTFTQKYQDTYKSIMQNLVRKGILIVDDNNSGDSKLERIRFTFPNEFKNKLPAPFLEIIEGHYQAEACDISLRNKICKIYNGQPANIKTNLYIENGLLQFNSGIFKLSAFDKWRKESLEQYIIKEYKNSKGYNGKNTFWKQFDLVKVLLDAFTRLKTNQFTSSESINSIFKVIYGDQHGINLEDVLIKTAELGFLGRITLDNKNYYQYKNTLEEESLQAKDYLISEAGRFIVVLNKIPCKALEQLSASCNFTIENKKTYITPDFSRLVQIYHTFKDTDLFIHLKNNLKSLSDRINEIEEKHGKVLLHSNLLIAKINDFKLLASLTKAYAGSNKFLFLPNDYIAFVQEERTNIEKLIAKSGFTVKKFIA